MLESRVLLAVASDDNLPTLAKLTGAHPTSKPAAAVAVVQVSRSVVDVALATSSPRVAAVADDFRGDTGTSGTVPIGGGSTGEVEQATDRDWFQVSLTANVSYQFTLIGDTLPDPTLALRDASGNEIAFNDDFDGRDSHISYTATSTGTYFLDAGGYGSSTGSYTLLAAFFADDYADNATTTGSMSIGGSSTGVVDATNDHDWFRVSLTVGHSYQFNLDGNTLTDPTLAIRDADGNQLAYNDDFETTDSQISFTPTSSGTYYLVAGAYGSLQGSYTIRSVDTTPTDDYAAGTDTVGTVSVGGGSTGVVEVTNDRDWFRVSLTAGRSYRFNLDGNTLADPTLALRDAGGNQLAYNDDFNGRNSQITFTPTGTGIYYLDAGAFSSGTGSYVLRAADTSPTDDYAAGVNTTGSLAVGGGVNGVIEKSGDRDWFRISLTAGQTYRFNLTGDTLSDPKLYLRNSSGAQLAFNDDFDGKNSQITFRATTSGRYYLDVGHYSSGTGSYSLAAAITTPPTPVSDDFAASTATRGSVTVGRSATGVVNSAGDRDWFRVTLAAGTTYRFNLNGTSLSDPSLYLRDGSGRQIEFNDDFNALNSQITYTTSVAGTYYLDAGALGSGLGGYTLLAAVVTTPTPSLDDYAGNSGTTGTVAIGGSQAGVVNTNRDRDWFRVTLQAGRTYRVSVDPGTLRTPDVFLRRSNGVQISYSNGSNGSNTPILMFACTTSGTYYIDVGSNRNVGVGTYTVRVVDTLQDDDYSADVLTTGSVAVGASSTGSVNYTGDRDWFRISLTAGQSYRFNCNGNGLADPTLALRDGTGTLLAYNDDFGTGTDSQITFAITSTGSYYLDAGAYGSALGTYSVSAASTTPVSDDFSADTATTGAIGVGQQAFGMINFVGDSDWFRVQLAAGRTYRFNLDGNTLSDPVLSLWNDTGSEQLITNDNSGGGSNSEITYTPAAGGTFYVDARAVGALTGTYVLSATDVSPTQDRIPGIQDGTIRNLVNTALSDNLFLHQELTALLRSTAVGGVTATELGDLQLVSANLGPYLSAAARPYEQYVFAAVVNGNAANQWWTGGASSRVGLGDLTAGSPQSTLDRLTDKWFAGSDLPTNFVGGDTAANASSVTFSYGQMTGSLFVNGIGFSDVNQGQAGTCYFLAAASSLANSQSQFIQNMFVDNGDGTYGVRFYGDSGNEIWVTVNRSVPVNGYGGFLLAGNSARSLAGEMWVALVEKAYAQANEIGQFSRSQTANSYAEIEGGCEEALRHISGRSTTAYSAYYSNAGWTSAGNNAATWNGYQRNAIAAVNAGRSLLLLCFGDTYDSSGKMNFVGNHAFAITGYNAATQRFTIANPWGAGDSSFAGVFVASWSEIFNVHGVVAWA